MEFIAAVDLLGGRARRLVQGDYDRPIRESADPLALATELLASGVRRLHVVDLDGAREGRPVNTGLVAAICTLAARSSPSAAVQCGGGLRSADSVARVLDAGVAHVVLGTVAVRDPDLVTQCVARWPGRIAAGLDLRDGRLRVAGWTETAGGDALALAEQLLAQGVERLIVTDVSRDGMRAGPNLALMAEFRARLPGACLVCAGGVSRPEDLAALERLGIDGAISGRALLDGSLNVADALAATVASTAAVPGA